MRETDDRLTLDCGCYLHERKPGDVYVRPCSEDHSDRLFMIASAVLQRFPGWRLEYGHRD